MEGGGGKGSVTAQAQRSEDSGGRLKSAETCGSACGLVATSHSSSSQSPSEPQIEPEGGREKVDQSAFSTGGTFNSCSLI